MFHLSFSLIVLTASVRTRRIVHCSILYFGTRQRSNLRHASTSAYVACVMHFINIILYRCRFIAYKLINLCAKGRSRTKIELLGKCGTYTFVSIVSRYHFYENLIERWPSPWTNDKWRSTASLGGGQILSKTVVPGQSVGPGGACSRRRSQRPRPLISVR